jgi:hypothetical protein
MKKSKIILYTLLIIALLNVVTALYITMIRENTETTQRVVLSIMFSIPYGAIIMIPIGIIVDRLNKHNKLHVCRNYKCGQHFREYQSSRGDCPYCKTSHPDAVEKEYPWMAHTIQFKKHNLKEYIQYLNMKQLIAKQREDAKSHKLWLKYWNNKEEK